MAKRKSTREKQPRATKLARRPAPAKRTRAVRKLGEDDFWKLIDDARQAKRFYSSLTALLKKLPPERIVAFENTLLRKLADAYRFPLLAANFIIQSYVSDDVFEDFRAWLVSQGRERFESALVDPESICAWLERDDVDSIDGESMLLVAANAYKEYGDEDEFFDRTKYPPNPALKIKWPRSKAGFARLYPQLVENFWNQERIRELH